MKPNDKNFGKTMDRALGLFNNPSSEQMEAARARFLKRADTDASDADEKDALAEDSVGRSGKWRWSAVAAIAAAIVVVVVLMRQSPAAVLDGARNIRYDETVSSNTGTGAVLRLADGSRVEMRAQSELVLERAEDGVRIRLSRGSVIVNAAPQVAGHLYVQTHDVTVSVIGTVFLVESAETGSRVAVIEGEVHVRQGDTSKRLLPGDQVTTAASMKALSVAEEVSWSLHAPEHMALLQQSVALAPATQTATPQPAGASIEGRVLRAGTSEPLAKAQVTLTWPNSNVPLPAGAQVQMDALTGLLSVSPNLNVAALQSLIESRERDLNIPAGSVRLPQQSSVVTDDTGAFSFKDLPPGRYSLRAERDGYYSPPVNDNYSSRVTRVVTVEAGKRVPDATLLMVQGGIISGRIHDPNGQPVSGVNVVARPLAYNNGREFLIMVSTKQSDDRGDYRLYNVPPGKYYVVAPLNAGNGSGAQGLWARTFFPGVTDPAAAMPVIVKEGGEVTGIDINIRQDTTGRFSISGVATSLLPSLKPNPITFVLAPRALGILDSGTPAPSPNALAADKRTNGEFEIRNVTPGEYDLYAYYQDNTLRRTFTSRTPVEVRNSDVTGLNIAIGPGATLNGEVVINTSGGSGAKPIELSSLRVRLNPLDTTPSSFVSIIGSLQMDAAGKFTTGNVPEARYSASLTGLPDTAYIQDIRHNGESVYDAGFVLSGAQVNPMQIVVNSAGGTVEGLVETRDRKPTAGATVVLVPPEARRQNAALYKVATTEESGRFSMRGVPPGQYTILAWESVSTTAWLNAKFLSQHLEKGKPIVVTAGGQVQTQLSAIPADPLR